MTNHKHLRVVNEDIYSNNNELTEELTLRLINEFRYSNLYIPAKRDEFSLNFIIYEDDNGLKLTPLSQILMNSRSFSRMRTILN